MKELLAKLLNIPAVAGNEERLTAFLVQELAAYCDHYTIDPLGSLIFHQKGEGEPILVNTPLSENGFFVTAVEENGRAKLAPIGNGEPGELLHQKVRNVEGTIFGVVGSDKKEGTPEMSDLFLDLGYQKKEEGEALLTPPQVFGVSGEILLLENQLFAPGLWSRVGVAVVIQGIKQLWKNHTQNLYFAFTVMDNLGFKGAKVAAQSLNPKEAYLVSGADPKAEGKPVVAGKGVGVRIKDSFAISNKPFRDQVTQLLEEKKISYQPEILTKGGLTNNEIMYLQQGILTVNLTVPVKNKGTAVEGVSLLDLEQTTKGLVEILLAK